MSHQPSNQDTHLPTTGVFFHSLDGLRGIAIISVVVFHTAYFNPASGFQNILHSLCKAGWLGVPLFFVLSGFLISYSVFKQSTRFDPVDYIVKRMAKIIPPFALSILLFGGIYHFVLGRPGIFASALAHLTSLAHFKSGWAEINPVYWSLMIEIHFYILFPVIYLLLKKISNRAEWLTFGIFVVVPLAARILTRLPENTPEQAWLLNANMLPKAMDNFSMGMLFAILLLDREKLPRLKRMAPRAAFSGALMMACCYIGYSYMQWLLAPPGGFYGTTSVWVFEAFKFLPSVASFLLLFSIFLPSQDPIYRLLNMPFLKTSGIISYEWFLFHYPPVLILGNAVGLVSGNFTAYLMRTALPFVLCLGISYVVWRFFSSPILMKSKFYLREREATRDKIQSI